MSRSEILTVIGIALSVLFWLVRPRTIADLVSKRKASIRRYGYLVIASLFTLFYVFVFVYLPIVVHVFNLGILAMSLILLWSLIGVWLPLLRRQHFWSTGVNRVVNGVGVTLAIIVLALFWIIVWPKWQTPTILTSILAFFLLAIYIIDRRQRFSRLLRNSVALVSVIRMHKTPRR